MVSGTIPRGCSVGLNEVVYRVNILILGDSNVNRRVQATEYRISSDICVFFVLETQSVDRKVPRQGGH